MQDLTNSNLISLTSVDEQIDVHFLGAVISYGLPSNPAEPRVYEVIDGSNDS